jgi:hypothetical protein
MEIEKWTLLSGYTVDRNELGADEMRKDDEELDVDAVPGGWSKTRRRRMGFRGKKRSATEVNLENNFRIFGVWWMFDMQWWCNRG